MINKINLLNQNLSQKFDILLFKDLAEFSANPSLLYKTLTELHKGEYSPNEKIVFYTTREIPESFLHYLYKLTAFIDISNFFVLICSNHKNKKINESVVNSMFTNKVESVGWIDFNETVDTVEFVNDYFIPDTICAIPWNNIEIKQDGNITPCCMSTNISYGNINNTTIEQAFYSEKANNFRQQLLNGEKPSECNACWHAENMGSTSIRQHNEKRLLDDFLNNTLANPVVRNLDLKFNNTCNFKCRICGPTSSSLIAQEQHKFFNIPLVQQHNWGESDQFKNQIINVLSNVNNIDMYGGEPFLIKKFSAVLQLAIDLGYSKNIRLHYNSNGSIWPENFVPLWSKFKKVDIHFSIDNIGEKFNLERGGNWNEVENNIFRLKNLKLTNMVINIMPTISIMNILYIDNVYQWAVDNNFNIFVSYGRGVGIDLQYLTKNAKKLIIEKYKNHPWSVLQDIIQKLNDFPDSDGRDFCQKMKQFDSMRNENFLSTHPEIAHAMGYSV